MPGHFLQLKEHACSNLGRGDGAKEPVKPVPSARAHFESHPHADVHGEDLAERRHGVQRADAKLGAQQQPGHAEGEAPRRAGEDGFADVRKRAQEGIGAFLQHDLVVSRAKAHERAADHRWAAVGHGRDAAREFEAERRHRLGREDAVLAPRGAGFVARHQTVVVARPQVGRGQSHFDRDDAFARISARRVQAVGGRGAVFEEVGRFEAAWVDAAGQQCRVAVDV